MFLLPLDFALVQLSFTHFCMCEGQMHIRKGGQYPDYCVVQRFDMFASI